MYDSTMLSSGGARATISVNELHKSRKHKTSCHVRHPHAAPSRPRLIQSGFRSASHGYMVHLVNILRLHFSSFYLFIVDICVHENCAIGDASRMGKTLRGDCYCNAIRQCQG